MMNHNFTPLQGPAPSPQSIKACPKCQSVFITESICESCGLQLSFDPYGQPMGEKSFYAIKDRYLFKMRQRHGMGLKAMEYLNPELKKSYLRTLVHRYQTLLSYFAQVKEVEDRRKYFLIEIKDIIPELLVYQVSDEIIWGPLEKLTREDDSVLLHIIEEGLSQGRRRVEEIREKNLLHRQWFGVLTTGAILRITIVLTSTVALSLAVFRYLML